MMYQQINPHLHQNFHNHSNHHHPQQQHNQAYPSIELQATTPIQHPQNQFVAHQNVQLLQQGQQIIQGYDQVNQVYTVQPQPIYYFPIFKQINEVIGDFSVSTMINISCYLAAFAILITYIVACSLGHQKWFPCMITSAGTDYPENIFFRIGLLTNIFYWLIMLVFEYWWLKAQSQALMNVVKVSSKMNLTAFIGFFFYGLTIATIDDGYIPTQFHGACAVIFFVLLCVYTQWNYYTVRQLRKLNPSFMSNSSFQRKRIFAYAWIFVFFFLILLALKFKWGLAVAEWIGTYSIIFYLQTFASDLKGFKLSVDDQQFTKHDMKVQLARNLEEKKQQEASQQINIVPTQQQQPQQQLYPVLQAAVPQNVVVVAQHNNHQLPQIQNRQHNNHKGQHETQHQHSQSFFQTHNHHREAAPQTQSHFQPNRVNAVNISESNSTADNSFMSIKKPLFSVNGQY